MACYKMNKVVLECVLCLVQTRKNDEYIRQLVIRKLLALVRDSVRRYCI